MGLHPLLVAFLILSAMIADAGHAHGTGTGWFLFFLLLAAHAGAWAWAWDYDRRLGGALAHEHPGRLGMIVTTSRPTPPAEQPAARTGIRVIARPALASQMARVRDAADRRSGRAATAAPAAELP